jgi:hypothetical protein
MPQVFHSISQSANSFKRTPLRFILALRRTAIQPIF